VGLSLVPASVRAIGPPDVCFRPLLDCAETAEIAVVYRRDRAFAAMRRLAQPRRDEFHAPRGREEGVREEVDVDVGVRVGGALGVRAIQRDAVLPAGAEGAHQRQQLADDGVGIGHGRWI
jgi:hypothetical protein